MEIAKMEMAALEKATVENTESVLIELDELQLTLVGGGVGDIILG